MHGSKILFFELMVFIIITPKGDITEPLRTASCRASPSWARIFWEFLSLSRAFRRSAKGMTVHADIKPQPTRSRSEKRITFTH